MAGKNKVTAGRSDPCQFCVLFEWKSIDCNLIMFRSVGFSTWQTGPHKPNTGSTHIDLLQQAILSSWLYNFYKDRRPPIINCVFAPRINPRKRDFIEKFPFFQIIKTFLPFVKLELS